MRSTIKKAISESVQDMVNAGFGTSFTERELRGLGIKIPAINIGPHKIRHIVEPSLRLEALKIK
jgi:putative transcriptional regulator